jgi:hypothetical protein
MNDLFNFGPLAPSRAPATCSLGQRAAAAVISYYTHHQPPDRHVSRLQLAWPLPVSPLLLPFGRWGRHPWAGADRRSTRAQEVETRLKVGSLRPFVAHPKPYDSTPAPSTFLRGTPAPPGPPNSRNLPYFSPSASFHYITPALPYSCFDTPLRGPLTRTFRQDFLGTARRAGSLCGSLHGHDPWDALFLGLMPHALHSLGPGGSRPPLLLFTPLHHGPGGRGRITPPLAIRRPCCRRRLFRSQMLKT